MTERKARRNLAQTKGIKKNLNAKKAYFLALWEQYQTFQYLTHKSREVKHCPSFHEVLLEEKKIKSQKNNFYSFDQNFNQVEKSPEKIVFHPVLSLPYKEADLYSYLEKEQAWNEVTLHVKKVIELRLSNVEKELLELCDTGQSDEYFIYQNMVTYYGVDKKFYENNKNLEAYLKIPLVANTMILNGLAKEEFKFYHLGDNQRYAMTLINAKMVSNYLYDLNTMRNNRSIVAK
jgi:hypothetical protein